MFRLVIQVVGKSFNLQRLYSTIDVLSYEHLVMFSRLCVSTTPTEEDRTDVLIPLKRSKFSLGAKNKRARKPSRLYRNKRSSADGGSKSMRSSKPSRIKPVRFKKKLPDKMDIDEDLILNECLVTPSDMLKMGKIDSVRYFAPETTRHLDALSHFPSLQTAFSFRQDESVNEMVLNFLNIYLCVFVYVACYVNS